MDKFTKFNTLGEVDVAASTSAYAVALTAWKTENEIPSDRIEAAVETVFDRTTGFLPMQALINFSVNEITKDPQQHKSLTTRVHAYVVGQRKAGRLLVKNGAGGGVRRLARPGEALPTVAKSA